MMEANGMIDGWLHGELSAEELQAFDARCQLDPEFAAEAQLAKRVEQSLKRSFAPASAQPSAVGALRQSIEARQRPAAGSALIRVLLAAAAGILLLLWQWDQSPDPAPRMPLPGELPMLPVSLSLPQFDGAERLGGGVLVPNLEGILCRASQFSERQAVEQCSPAELSARRVSMGDALGLSKAALAQLEGPIVSSEWPGSMVFAEQSSSGISLLIAGEDALNTCCLQVLPPENSQLRVHTWRVGSTLWYEVSPFDEPRLLSLVDSF